MQPQLRPPKAPREKESLVTRALRFGRSLVVGAGATLADLTTLTTLVAIFHVSPETANVPSLLVGLAVQFIGARQWVFKAGEGNFKRHLTLFTVVETGALILNAVIFWAAVRYTPIPYWAARPVGTFLVYVGFSYPLWKRIFRVEAARELDPEKVVVTVPEEAVRPGTAPPTDGAAGADGTAEAARVADGPASGEDRPLGPEPPKAARHL